MAMKREEIEKFLKEHRERAKALGKQIYFDDEGQALLERGKVIVAAMEREFLAKKGKGLEHLPSGIAQRIEMLDDVLRRNILKIEAPVQAPKPVAQAPKVVHPPVQVKRAPRGSVVQAEPKGGKVVQPVAATKSVKQRVQEVQDSQQQKPLPTEKPKPKAVHYVVHKQVTQYTEHEAPKQAEPEPKPMRPVVVQKRPPTVEAIEHKEERKRIIKIIHDLGDATAVYIDKYDSASGGKKKLPRDFQGNVVSKGKGFLNAKADVVEKVEHALDRDNELNFLSKAAHSPDCDLDMLKKALGDLIKNGLEQDKKDRGWTKGDVERDLKIAGHALDPVKYPDDPEKKSRFGFGKKGH